MKKAKLFMMLALLVMGVSNMWGESWDDGTFVYNTTFNQSSSNSNVQLPDGEVAISLYLGKTKNNVRDTVYYGAPFDDGNHIEYIGVGYTEDGNSHYYYVRRHSISYPGADVTSVTIPATVKHNGKTYKVTAIQKLGFTYTQSKWMGMWRCGSTPNPNNPDSYDWWPVVSNSNRELREVDFSKATNLKYIGDYAFMACDKLRSVTLPKTIEYLGTGAFEMCDWLHECNFQDDECGFELLRNWTFWMCISLKNLQLPDGITEIQGRTPGAALQYLFKLTDIRLPNTLNRIGAHFLCCASSLEKLTIPASVTYIDAACFHGCETLKEVYLLGTASALQPGTTGSMTFGKNDTFCKNQVSDCTFYTTPDYVNSYADHRTWALIADNQVGGYLCEVDDEGNILYENGQPVYVLDANNQRVKVKTSSGNGNRLVSIAEVKRTFEADKWVTAIFPETFKHKFAGDENVTTGYNVFSTTDKPVRVARMTSATAETGTDPDNGKPIRLYHLTFTLVDESQFQPDVPYMFCPGRKVEDYVMISKTMYNTQAFKQKMTQDLKTSINADDGAVIDMLGHYKDWDLYDYCFYFSYKKSSTQTTEDESAKFYRVPEGSRITSAPTRCFWYVKVDGIKTRVGAAKVSSQKFFDIEEDNSTTGIEEMETRFVIDAIYDLNGRKLNVKPEDLPKGLFIINGKKVMINK